MAKLVKMTPLEYRHFVALQYWTASAALYKGLKEQQTQNSFHFVVTMRSFIEYTRRGIWFLVWADDEHVSKVRRVTFQKPGSPGVPKMDAMINQALGLGNVSHLTRPIKEINDESFLDCLHALTHGNPISVRMISFGVDKIFQIDKLLLRAETDLNLFGILLFRKMLGEEPKDIFKSIAGIHDQPDAMRTNARIAAHRLRATGIPIPQPD